MNDDSLRSTDFSPEIDAALVRLGRKTLRGISALRRCDLFDALDHDPTLSELEKSDAIFSLEQMLVRHRMKLLNEGRFESWDEVVRFVPAAAQELGVACERTDAGRYGQPMLTLIFDSQTRVEVQGRVNFVSKGGFEPIVPFIEQLNAHAPDGGEGSESNAKAREVLRRAQALAAAAG